MRSFAEREIEREISHREAPKSLRVTSSDSFASYVKNRL